MQPHGSGTDESPGKERERKGGRERTSREDYYKQYGLGGGQRVRRQKEKEEIGKEGSRAKEEVLL